jgi:spermidine/putrescine transport system substrate-binding protein
LNGPSNPPNGNGDARSEPASGISRRSLFRRGGAAAIALGAGAALAGCENTTTPVASGAGGGGRGILGDPTAGGPVDSAGIPLARKDYPVTMPRLGDAVSSSAKPERGGELRVYNYADYVNPAVIKDFGKREGVSVRVTTFDTLDEAFSKLSTGGLQFDVIFSTPDQLSRLVGAQIVQPLNYELIPNLQKNVWPELHDPFYDVGPRYTVPYVTYTTGIAWRNDLLGFDPSKLDQPWDAFWNAAKYRGKVAILDDSREAPGMALMRRGITDLNTEKPELIQQAVDDLEQLDQNVGVKVSIADYETVPAGRVWLHQAWSGDMISGAIGYMPKGVKPDVLSYWYQPEGGPIFNDCICVAAKATKPVIAHRFLNYMLDNDAAYKNFAGFVGYQPPLNSIDANALFEKEIIPNSLRQAVVTREAYANGNAYLTLSAEGLQLWDKQWARFRNG